MFYKKLILSFYCTLTFLCLISAITVSFIDFLPGIVFMWLIYWIFDAGVKSKKRVFLSPVYLNSHGSKYLPVILSFAFIVFYPKYIEFYTGQNVLLHLINFFAGNSNYISYQQYFQDADIGVFSIKKIPFILGNGILKFLYIATVFKSFTCTSRSKALNNLSVFVMTLLFLLVSVSRGTSFEFFELFMMFMFGYLLKNKIYRKKDFFGKKELLICIGTCFVFVVYFSYNLKNRGELDCVTQQICYDSNSILASMSPGVAKMTMQLSAYFLFGLFFVSKVIVELWMNSFYFMLSIFVPNGLSTLGLGESYSKIVCGNFIDCGACWIPDVISFIQNYGLLCLFVGLFYIGRYSKVFYAKAISGDIVSAIILYYIFISLISLPVGNFISSSSGNMLAVFIAICFYKFPCLNKLILNYLR